MIKSTVTVTHLLIFGSLATEHAQGCTFIDPLPVNIQLERVLSKWHPACIF